MQLRLSEFDLMTLNKLIIITIEINSFSWGNQLSEEIRTNKQHNNDDNLIIKPLDYEQC